MRQKVKTFFQTFLKSLIPTSAYYKKILRLPFGISLAYFFGVILFFNILLVFFIVTKYNPVRLKRALSSLNVGLNSYPDNLTINIKNGNLSMTVNRPFFLWIGGEDDRKLFLVVDVNATPQKIRNYKSTVLLTGREIVFKNHTPGRPVFYVPFTYFKNISINSVTITNIQNLLTYFGSSLYGLYLLIITCVFLFLLISTFFIMLINLIIASLIAFLVFRFMKKTHPRYRSLNFPKTFHIALHSSSLPITIDYLLIFLAASSGKFPIVFFLLLLIFLFGGIIEAYYQIPSHKKT